MSFRIFPFNLVIESGQLLQQKQWSPVSITPFPESQEIVEIVKLLNKKKSPGADLITNKMVKLVTKYRPHFITFLMKGCLQNAYFPAIWCMSRVVLILEGTMHPDSVKQLRQITNLPCVGKLFEKLVNTRLLQHFDERGLFSERQYGFRMGRSTYDTAAAAITYIKNSLDSGLAVLLDISSAFDNIWWPTLLDELQKYEVPEGLINIIYSYLQSWVSQIIINEVTREEEVHRSVSQGSDKFQAIPDKYGVI